MKYPYFSTIPKDKLKEISAKGNEALRTPELKKAWADKEKIKELDKTMSRRALAKVYGVSHSSISRIVKS